MTLLRLATLGDDGKLDPTQAPAASAVTLPYTLVTASGDTSGDEDTGNIQTALDALGDAGGGKLILGAGALTAKKLTLPSRVYVEGQGVGATVLKLANGVNDNLIEGESFQSLTGGTSNGGILQFGIRALTIDGNRANNATPVTNGGRGIAFYGYQFLLQDLVVRNCAKDGIYAEWFGPGVFPTGGSDANADFTDAQISFIKTHHNGDHGFWYYGPHDSVVYDLLSFYNDGNSNIRAEGQGFHWTNCHAFGGSCEYAWELRGNNMLTNCIGEGATVAQFYVNFESVQIRGGQCYSPGSSTAAGVLFAEAVGDTEITGLQINGFSSASGPAIDFSNTVTGTSTPMRVQCAIDQTTGTPIKGTPPSDAYLDISVSGMSGSVMQIPGYQLTPAGTTPNFPPSINDPFLGTSGTALNATNWAVTKGTAATTPAVNGSNLALLTNGATGGFSSLDRIYVASTLAPSLKDVEMLFSVVVEDTAVAHTLLAYLRGSNVQVGSNSGYAVQVAFFGGDNVGFSVEKIITSTATTLFTDATLNGISTGQKYWIRFRVQGTTLYYRRWADGTQEPSAWTWSGTDSALTAGLVGFEAFGGSAATAGKVGIGHTLITAL